MSAVSIQYSTKNQPIGCDSQLPEQLYSSLRLFCRFAPYKYSSCIVYSHLLGNSSVLTTLVKTQTDSFWLVILSAQPASSKHFQCALYNKKISHSCCHHLIRITHRQKGGDNNGDDRQSRNKPVPRDISAVSRLSSF